MKLSESALSAKAEALGRLMGGATLEVLAGPKRLASIQLPTPISHADGTLEFGKMPPVTASGSGVPDRYRIIGGNGLLILEGDAGQDLRLESRTGELDRIEQGAAVMLVGISYVETAGE